MLPFHREHGKVGQAAFHDRSHPSGESGKPDGEQWHMGVAPDVGVFHKCAGWVRLQDVAPSLAADEIVAAPFSSGGLPGDPAVRLKLPTSFILRYALPAWLISIVKVSPSFNRSGPTRIPAQQPRTIQPCVVSGIGQQAEHSVRSSVDEPNYADRSSLRISDATGSSHVV